MKTGMKVTLTDGTTGTVEYVTVDGWIGVRQGSRIDEWQPSQVWLPSQLN